jgi:hypothetical protein
MLSNDFMHIPEGWFMSDISKPPPSDLKKHIRKPPRLALAEIYQGQRTSHSGWSNYWSWQQSAFRSQFSACGNHQLLIGNSVS